MSYIVKLSNISSAQGAGEYDGGRTLDEARREASFFASRAPRARITINKATRDGRLRVVEVYHEPLGEGFNPSRGRDPQHRSTAWQSAARRYLERLGKAEWEAQGRPVPNPRTAGVKNARRGRFAPSEYHRQLVELLGRNDEEGFKALKSLEGYASDLGV